MGCRGNERMMRAREAFHEWLTEYHDLLTSARRRFCYNRSATSAGNRGVRKHAHQAHGVAEETNCLALLTRPGSKDRRDIGDGQDRSAVSSAVSSGTDHHPGRIRPRAARPRFLAVRGRADALRAGGAERV